METIIRKVSEDGMGKEALKEAAEILRRGGLVAFPTETVYGLGANALDPEASARIYAAKGRPSDNPLIVHIAEIGEVERLAAKITPAARVLMEKFWPGPMTLLFPKRDCIPDGTTGGLDTVGVRMPSHPVARELILAAGIPVAAPSANASGKPSPTRAEHVAEDMLGKIDMILDGGSVGIGVESTVIDVTSDTPVICRPGFISLKMLQSLFPQASMDPACREKPRADLKPRAPGMKYRHYAPKAGMTIVEGEAGQVQAYIQRMVREEEERGGRAGVICSQESRKAYSSGVVKCAGSRLSPETIAHNLFGVLRDFDHEPVTKIYSESFWEGEMGEAVMNRLIKAAGYSVVDLTAQNGERL